MIDFQKYDTSMYFLRNEQKLTTLGIFDLHLGVYFLLRCDYIECFFSGAWASQLTRFIEAAAIHY
jgi:hypothetical protein